MEGKPGKPPVPGAVGRVSALAETPRPLHSPGGSRQAGIEMQQLLPTPHKAPLTHPVRSEGLLPPTPSAARALPQPQGREHVPNSNPHHFCVISKIPELPLSSPLLYSCTTLPCWAGVGENHSACASLQGLSQSLHQSHGKL